MARKGNQKPTQARIISTRNSLYNEAVSLYEKTGQKAQKWQIYLLKAIFARNKKGLWIHTKFGYALPRRNGKNEVVAMRELKALEKGEQCLHTAHRTTTSHAAWERLCRLLDKAGITYQSLRATGRESIELEDTGGRVEFRTRTTTGGLGEGFDLLVIDEAQEYTTDQESALKYVVSDSKNPQTILCGTPPTPLSGGTVFVNYRKNCLNGTLKNAGWAEWSIEDEADPHDKELWYLTNPSLGTILTERAIEDEIGDDITDFNIQRLGLWIKYNQKSAISIKEWGALEVDILPELTGNIFVGIKYGNDGANVAVSIAVKTYDNNIFIESVDCRSIRAGNMWIIEFLKNSNPQEIVIDGASGQNLLVGEMKEFGVSKKPICPTVQEIIIANAAWEQGIYQKKICHKNQPSLSQVVTNCEKRNIGTRGGFGYKSQYDDMDIALMDSALLAYWVCSEAKPIIKQRCSC